MLGSDLVIRPVNEPLGFDFCDILFSPPLNPGFQRFIRGVFHFLPKIKETPNY